MVKTCIRCGDLKEIENFYKHSCTTDGHLNKCKSCCRKEAAANRQANLERNREYDRSRDSERRRSARRTYTKGQRGREARRRAQAAYSARNPLKRAAHAAVNNALRDGKLTKPDRCEKCHKLRKLEAHHPDYKNPLEVLWLDDKCHKAVHRQEREARRNSVLVSNNLPKSSTKRVPCRSSTASA